MGLIAGQMTKAKTKPEAITLPFGSPYVDPVRVRELVYAVAVEVASRGLKSSPVGSRGYSPQDSYVWFTAAPPSVAVGVPLISGKRSVDWQVDVEGGSSAGGGTALVISTPYYLTQDGDLANRQAYRAVRDRLRDALSSGRLPTGDLDRSLVTTGLAAWPFVDGLPAPETASATVVANVDRERVTGWLTNMLFHPVAGTDEFRRRTGVLGECTLRVVVEGAEPVRLRVEAALVAGRTIAESRMSSQLARARIGRLMTLLREADPSMSVDGDLSRVVGDG